MHDTGIPIVYLPTHVHRHAYTWHALEGGVGKKSNNEVVCVCEPQTLAADLHLHERKRAWEKESLGERARVRSCICAWGRARAMKCLLCTWFNVTSRATLLIDVVFYAKRNSSVTLLKTPFTCMMQTISSKITNHLSPYPPKPRSTRPRYLPKWERSLCYGAHRATTLSEFYFAERKKKERIHGCSNYNENISSLDLFIHLKVKESGVMFWVWSCSECGHVLCITLLLVSALQYMNRNCTLWLWLSGEIVDQKRSEVWWQIEFPITRWLGGVVDCVPVWHSVCQSQSTSHLSAGTVI